MTDRPHPAVTVVEELIAELAHADRLITEQHAQITMLEDHLRLLETLLAENGTAA